MLAPAVLMALLVAAPIAVPPTPNAIGAIPDEPGAFVLPDAPILQTVAADLDGDGRRELVRLIRGDGDAALAEVWVERGSNWALLGQPVEVVPPSRVGTRIDPVYQATPVRLLVRRVDGAERVTVASQPHFEEIDIGDPCCLLLHDLVIEPGGGARRVEVAESSDFADAVLVIDLDGDGTDELLVTQSLPPLGDISYPTLARVHRWADGAFGAPTLTELSIGSGDAPFLLGDSDGLPGDEAAIISTLGPSGLFRISAGPDDRLSVDPAGITVDQALAVPLAAGRGVAVSGPVVGFVVAPWPAGSPMSTPVGASPLSDVRLLGMLAVEGEPRLAVHRPGSGTLHLLGLPDLTPWRQTSIERSLAARLSSRPPDPYVGPLPGSGGGVIHAGRLIVPTGAGIRLTPVPMATLAGAEPIGFVGDATILAVHHAPLGPSAPGPGGGRLTVPAALPLAWTSIVPFDLVRAPEADVGALDAAIRGAVRLDAENDVAVGRDGLIAEVSAPPGSRVLVSDGASVSGLPVVVPEGGLVEVRLGAAVDDESTMRRARLVVTTPAGHAYRAAWDILTLSGPPPIEAEVTTLVGSSMVEVRGVTLRHATVRVHGRAVGISPAGRFTTRVEVPPWPTDIVIEVDDSLGNVARITVSGVGWFDYRGLPWVPMVAAIVGIAALFLILRVPRPNPLRRPADDDSTLEELEPD